MGARKRWAVRHGGATRCFLVVLAFTVSAFALAQNPPQVLWYRHSVKNWSEALPVGNGHLGATVLGQILAEWIQLNVDSLMAGQPVDRDRKGANVHLLKARELLFADKYRAAEQLVQREFMPERWVRSHQTLGDRKLKLPGDGAAAGYRR